jgi:hypothetical protein
LAWVEVKPKYLDYEYCQILLIGEKMEAGVEPTTKDQKHDKETPQEEIEKLEHEDELRVEHLHGDDSSYEASDDVFFICCARCGLWAFDGAGYITGRLFGDGELNGDG